MHNTPTLTEQEETSIIESLDAGDFTQAHPAGHDELRRRARTLAIATAVTFLVLLAMTAATAAFINP